MQNWITEFMAQFGYLSVFLLITIENIFPPIPSEIILTFGGFMTTYTEMSAPGVVIVATAGSVIGACLLYGIGRLLDVKALEKIIGRWGHILTVKASDLQRAGSWFQRYGFWAVFLCRMIPIVRSLISIPAGMAKMNIGYFLLYTTLGTLIWNSVLVFCGVWLGESWEDILGVMNVYSTGIYVVIILAIIILILFRVFKKRRK